MIDFHCHIDLYPNPHAIARRCSELGIYTLSVTTTPSAYKITSSLAGTRTKTALGLHPQLAKQRISELVLFDQLLPEAAYVGEIGLDGSPEYKDSWEQQIIVLRHILASSTRAGGRIMSIHSRRAAGPVLKMLEAFPASGWPVLHWFSGSITDLNHAIQLGCWFSVGPAMLAGKRGQNLASKMPRNRVLTETDGPFASDSGNPLHPWDAYKAEQSLASLWNKSIEETKEILQENLRNLVSRQNENNRTFNDGLDSI